MPRLGAVNMGKPPVRMTEATCRTLVQVAEHPGYVSEISKGARLAHTTVIHALYRMAKAGWLFQKLELAGNGTCQNIYRVTEKGLIAVDVARKILNSPSVEVLVPSPPVVRERFHRYPVQLEKDPADPKWVQELKDGLPSDVLLADPCCLEFGPCRNCERPVWRVVGKPTWTHFLHAADPYQLDSYPKPCASPQTAHGVNLQEVL